MNTPFDNMSPFDKQKTLKMALDFLLKRAAEEDRKSAAYRDTGNKDCQEFHKRLADESYRMVAEIQDGSFWTELKKIVGEDYE